MQPSQPKVSEAMNRVNAINHGMDENCKLLASLLEVETRHYRRLLRLAWRQNSYMKRQDVDRLDANAREWGRYLPEADEARIARERFVQEMARTPGFQSPDRGVEGMRTAAGPRARQLLDQALNDMKAVSVRLARQNELNRQLAEFCLDLAREEAEIFKKAVLSDPTGCYGQNAQNTTRGAGGVLVKQA